MSSTNMANVFRLERHHLRRLSLIVVSVSFVLLIWSYGFLSHNTYTDVEDQLLGRKAEHGTGSVGLTASGRQFLLNGKPFTIIGGSIHYFRVPPKYWKDRLLKMRAGGANTLVTYIAWNIHEQIRGHWKWDGAADIREFVKIAAEVGLYVILRPGPFICAEWEFGGMPSWLLHDPQMQVRTTYQPFISAMNQYFQEFMKQVKDLQYAHGGPIIGFQVENEYGVFGANDQNYLLKVKQALTDNGVVEALFSSGNVWLETEAIPGVHLAINFQDYKDMGVNLISKLEKIRPGQPLLVMEFWTGWFDHWGEIHHTWSLKETTGNMTEVLKAGASLNMYVFHGGTSFGFMNGANAYGGYTPAITSYDYDAPLSEAGDMTMKYSQIKEVLLKHAASAVSDNLPSPPPNSEKGSYGIVIITTMLHWENILAATQAIESEHLVPMEMLDINNNGGQSYGYIVYRKEISNGEKLQFTSVVRDRAIVLLDSKQADVFNWTQDQRTVSFPYKVSTQTKLDIMVENLGRVNIAGSKSQTLNNQRKGLEYPVQLDGKSLDGWKIYPLEFKEDFVNSLQALYGWTEEISSPHSPALYRGTFTVTGQPKDTFIRLQKWEKGCVFINQFNIGRYWNIGPQKTLYIPATILKSGQNQLLIFELHMPGLRVELIDHPELG